MNHELLPLKSEGKITENKIKITSESLYNDNHSEEANEARYIWSKAKSYGSLLIVQKCSDARVFLPSPDTSVAINYIAEGCLPPEPQQLLLASPGVAGEVILAHFDGETFQAGKMPEGCGGLKAKKDQIETQKMETYLDKYIEKHIIHPDPILQACFSALETVKYTEKPVFVAAQDHRTGETFPVAAFYSWGDEKEIVAHKDILGSLFGHRYDPASFYRNGIPQIGEDKLAKIFVNFLNEAQEKSRRINDKYPDFYIESSIQDPPLVVLSTNIIPFAACFPRTGAKPGTVFEVFVPRKRVEASVSIKEDELEPSLYQIEYPIRQSLQNNGQDGKPFANTNTILIDTEHISLSRTLAYKLCDQIQSVKDWLNIKTHKILISETEKGILSEIKEFTY